MEGIRDTEFETFIERRDMLLRNVSPEIVRKAWFTLSHLLLDEGAKLVDMGCNDGAMTYAMAAMAPKLKFTGLDKSKRQINKAREQYQLHNLDFKVGDVSSEIFEPESLDAIINSYVLHEVYSGSRYNERIVSDTLRRHFQALKKGGVMFIRDFARPPPEELVLLELPDLPGDANDPSKMSEADLLIWYSEHARPRQDAGCGGFFIEEMPQRFPKTRLFRLSYKWAYEFIMRKNDRPHWETMLPMEYTFFTPREFRKELSALGARVQYSGPYWDEDIIEREFEGKFGLYKDNGTPLGHPPTCFIAVAYKMAERKSLSISERRPVSSDKSRLKITAMRDEKTGRISDVVGRDFEAAEILPYFIDEEDRLKIYLHDGVARSIANAVPRSGINIDGRRWSGHMIESLAVRSEEVTGLEALDIKNTALFCRDHLGLIPQKDCVLEHGPDYYPSPDYIDERIFTFYLKVERARMPVNPKNVLGQNERFQAKGIIREFDAQQVLNAISVGMIPNARLELQILSLYQRLGITAENWVSRYVKFQAGKIGAQKSLRALLSKYGMEKRRFKEIKGTAGELRPIHSTFVEEGQTRGAVAGISSQEVDFVIQDGKTVNTAVVIPLTKGIKGDIHAGFTLDFQPVPQRHEGNGLTISAPSFNLPPEVTNLKLAKKYIADKFGLTPEMVIKMGESYYSHMGVTPQKIHPFAVTAPGNFPNNPSNHFLPFYQLMLLRNKLLSTNVHFMVTLARSYRFFHDEMRRDAQLKSSLILKQRFGDKQPDWSIPLSYHTAPVKPVAAPKKQDKQETLNKKTDLILTTAPQAVQDNEPPPMPPMPNYQDEEMPAQLMEDFEREVEEFLETIENEEEYSPKPEKW